MRFGVLAAGASILLILAIGRHDDAPGQAAIALAGAVAIGMTLVEATVRERFPDDHGVAPTIGRWTACAVVLVVAHPLIVRPETSLAGLAAASSLVLTLTIHELAQRRRRRNQRELEEADARFWIAREANRRRGISRDAADWS